MGEEGNERIGDYELLGVLGSGGMGKVYRVRNVISARIEAMKVLLPDLVAHQELAARFQREIKLLASLHHPNIAALRTAFSHGNELVMIMEYVEGMSLAARLNRGPITTLDALNYVDQVLDALSYAHRQHVIHRDIKPANMMLTPQGIVKLTDFGIARSSEDQPLTKTGMTPGSLRYISPEQINGLEADERSDLYSLGISLYEMVTGQRPFQADSDYGLMSAHLREAPRPPTTLQPSLPAGINNVILTALEKDPDRRFQAADTFRDALRNLRQDLASSPAATAAPDTTIDDSAVDPVLQEAVMPASNQTPSTSRSGDVSDYASTVVSARTPSRQNAQAPLTATPAKASPARARGTKHPALYMALGGLLVIGGLISIAVYSRRAEADTPREQPVAAPPVVAEPAIPATTPPLSPEAQATTAPAPDAGIGSAKPPAQRSGQTAEATPRRAAGAPAASGQAASPGLSGLDQLEHEIDQISVRAAAVHNSLDRLHDQLAGSGLGLRGDMAARQDSLKLNLAKAQDAVNEKDTVRAKRYRDLADSDVEVLERFLGR